ncbi:MAG: J domain-containing protein [Gammaproteobacteria bacterium]|nr:J domain-containing protein [Gammaproteobacteria bacterium]
MTDHITAYPLTWPNGWKRSKVRQHSQFSKKTERTRRDVTLTDAVTFVLDELRRMEVRDWNVIISTNVELRLDGLPRGGKPAPVDTGVSVWWKDGNKQLVIAIDKYYRVADNLYAIGKTIEAMRGIDRWGSGEILERTFTGFQALPNPDAVNWRDVLDYRGNDLAECKVAYRRAIGNAHPDRGGNDAQAAIVNKAWEMAQGELS